MARQILHIDMDAFFAAVEQRDHPEYQGKPVIVGADPKDGKGRGVVSTCSYEARKFGVHSAMPISKAYQLCPRGIYLRPNINLYAEISDEIFKMLEQFTDLVEVISIDEAFLDITGSIKLLGSAKEIAIKIKKNIFQEQRLSASVGIAPNKFLAKIASDLEKPDGLVIVNENEIEQFLFPLDISYIWGAGKKTVETMQTLGIHKIGDLAKIPKDALEMRFGKLGSHFYNLAHGIDDRPVSPGEGVKSVSNEITFEEDCNDTKILDITLFQLCEKVGYRLRKKSLKGKTIHLKLRYTGFETITRNRTLTCLTANTETIYKIIKELFDYNYQKGRKVRLLGVGVSGFIDELGHQLSLFEKSMEGDNQLDLLEDLIRTKFGKEAILRAESLQNKLNKK
jgi:DNA polymerase-4